MNNLKGSTLVETVVASLIIVITFMILTTVSTLLFRRSTGYRYYVEMRACRDSVISLLVSGQDVPQHVLRSWGSLTLTVDNEEIIIETSLESGHNQQIYYLINANKKGTIGGYEP